MSVLPGECNPPWVAFPEIPYGSIGWRMGGGEMAWDAFSQWYAGLSDDEAADFARRNPEPGVWQGHYAMIREPWQEDDD